MSRIFLFFHFTLQSQPDTCLSYDATRHWKSLDMDCRNARESYNMRLLPIFDTTTCTLCGKCVEVCPHSILNISDGAVAFISDDCMLCTHCYATCPTSSISFDPDVLVPINDRKVQGSIPPPSTLSHHDVWDLFTSRRSIRRYKNTPVPDEIVSYLIDFAVTSPSGSNCQLWCFHVINGRDRVWSFAGEIKKFFIRLNKLTSNIAVRLFSVLIMGKKLIRYYQDHYDSVERAILESENGIDRLFHGAPCIIVIHSPIEGSTPIEDGILASYNILLMAHALGLGTCYVGYAVEAINRSKPLKQYLSIPNHHRIHAVLTLGYPAIAYKRASLRKHFSFTSQ